MKIGRRMSSYHKFVKGKDVSKYSDKDLASILGSTTSILKFDRSDEKHEENDFVTRNLGSMTDYFSKKQKEYEYEGISSSTLKIGEGKRKDNSKYGGDEENSHRTTDIDDNEKAKLKITVDSLKDIQLHNSEGSRISPFECRTIDVKDKKTKKRIYSNVEIEDSGSEKQVKVSSVKKKTTYLEINDLETEELKRTEEGEKGRKERCFKEDNENKVMEMGKRKKRKMKVHEASDNSEKYENVISDSLENRHHVKSKNIGEIVAWEQRTGADCDRGKLYEEGIAVESNSVDGTKIIRENCEIEVDGSENKMKRKKKRKVETSNTNIGENLEVNTRVLEEESGERKLEVENVGKAPFGKKHNKKWRENMGNIRYNLIYNINGGKFNGSNLNSVMGYGYVGHIKIRKITI